MFTAQRPALAPAGQQHHPLHACRRRGPGERTDRLGGAVESDIGGVGEIHRGHPLQYRVPRVLVLPVEPWLSGTRPDPDVMSIVAQPGSDPAAGLTGAGEHEDGWLRRCDHGVPPGVEYIQSRPEKHSCAMTARRRVTLVRPGALDVRAGRTHAGTMMTSPVPGSAVDPLGYVLHTLRLAGTFYCHSELTEPWGMTVPAMPDHL